MSNTIKRLLVLPDAHAHPEYDNRRFDKLNRFIKDYGPSHIVCLGDFADCPSLSSYDKGKRGFEGRRYSKDIAVTKDAMSRMMKGVKCRNLTMLLGNHEDRINRATSNQAELDGTISPQDLGYEKHGWTVYPYKSEVNVGGYLIAHNFFTRMGQPMGGKFLARSLLNELKCSAIVGHSHLKDYATGIRRDSGRRIESIVAGHFAHPDMKEESWAKGTASEWWQGVVCLEEVLDGSAGVVSFVDASAM